MFYQEVADIHSDDTERLAPTSDHGNGPAGQDESQIQLQEENIELQEVVETKEVIEEIVEKEEGSQEILSEGMQ